MFDVKQTHAKGVTETESMNVHVNALPKEVDVQRPLKERPAAAHQTIPCLASEPCWHRTFLLCRTKQHSTVGQPHGDCVFCRCCVFCTNAQHHWHRHGNTMAALISHWNGCLQRHWVDVAFEHRVLIFVNRIQRFIALVAVANFEICLPLFDPLRK